ncbi:hypothetical protein EON80_10445 [bacterium]|nr:MAG: hypothetical protein EON80_10445 [bacterium]
MYRRLKSTFSSILPPQILDVQRLSLLISALVIAVVLMPSTGCTRPKRDIAKGERLVAEASYRDAYVGWVRSYASAAEAYKKADSPSANAAFADSLEKIWDSRQSFKPARRSERFTIVDLNFEEGLRMMKDATRAGASGVGTQEMIDQIDRGQDFIRKAEDEFVKLELEFIKDVKEWRGER